MDKNFVITVARGFGTGGKEIAAKVAEKLGIYCYENRILTLASQLSGVNEEQFSDVNEKRREIKKNGFAALLAKLPYSKGYITRNEKFVSDDQLFEYQKEIIEQLADTESCVIVGKCADWILKNRQNVLSVYVEAPRPFCVARTMEEMKVSEAVAHNTITATDKFRAEYYAYYTKGNYWTNPVNYDLTINSERLSIDMCVELIISTLMIKLPHLIKE